MSDLAYLVIREGAKWTDVFRLVPGQTVTIGRAPTNQIVVKDERCSRNHAELFVLEGQWTIRDLESRNGTVVQEQLVKGDRPLASGDLIRIGRSQLVFVHNLSEAFSDTAGMTRRGNQRASVPAPANRETSSDLEGDSNILSAYEPATITHRKGQTRFLAPTEKDEGTVSRAGRAAAYLCRLAFELAKTPEAARMAELALNGLFDSTQADAGAVLLLPRDFQGEASGANLEVVASRTLTEQRYHQVSNFLARTVMREQEAVLARNVMGDSNLGSRDSKGEILATSVICAPVRHGQCVQGLIHLYSTDPARALDPDDLEFTLAVADTLAVAVTNLNRREELAQNLILIRNENVELRERLGVQSEIIGRSPQLRQISEEIARAAASRATVLIRGESGAGKELVARAVHFSSSRSKNPFVCLNCAALSEDLLASELFGHEKGAFTGATERKIGKFEAADGGTLMLDEIGEMSPNIQAKFLRVLEGHPFERVGGSKPVKVDVRVIAATNRDLEKDAAEGRFRRDLFFRLRVLEIIVPALRKRPDDIPVLANYFLEKFRSETGRKIRGYTPRAMEQLIAYRWPGNVRELRNVVERAVVLCTGQYIDQGDLLLSNLATAGDTMQHPPADRGFHPCSLADMERSHIEATLKHTGWNKSRTASILGIERSTLDRKIRRYRLVEGGPRDA
ncbi:MAG: sigma 54-interacting transcriptional regulator [Pirellulales bacterium]|nr:sigma 54-interacting transcriptional regulator [Pirellulales bacterium]